MAPKTNQHILDYHACTTSDLRTFITSRTGQTSPANLTKHLYVQELRKLDSRARFRFLDLGLELRVRVYNDLLVSHRGNNGCFPQILATCKSISDEATKILYTQHPGKVHITAAAGLKFYTCTAQSRESGDTACLEHVGWDAHLLRVANLYVVVDLKTVPEARAEANTPVAKRVNNLLYSLVNYLAEAAELVNVVVRVRGDDGCITSSIWAKMLWPLTKIMNKERRVRVIGAPDAAVKQVLAAARERKEGDDVDLVKRYWELEEKVKDYKGLAREINRECCPSTEVDAAAMRLEDMALGNAFVDEQWENELLRIMLQLEEVL